MKRERPWNKCNTCGRFIGLRDFESGKAIRSMVTPDSEFTAEEFENTCYQCRINQGNCVDLDELNKGVAGGEI